MRSGPRASDQQQALALICSRNHLAILKEFMAVRFDVFFPSAATHYVLTRARSSVVMVQAKHSSWRRLLCSKEVVLRQPKPGQPLSPLCVAASTFGTDPVLDYMRACSGVVWCCFRLRSLWLHSPCPSIRPSVGPSVRLSAHTGTRARVLCTWLLPTSEHPRPWRRNAHLPLRACAHHQGLLSPSTVREAGCSIFFLYLFSFCLFSSRCLNLEL